MKTTKLSRGKSVGRWTGRYLSLLVLTISSFLCAPLPVLAATTVTASGQGGSVSQTLPDTGGPFDLSVPLNRNAVNTIRVTAVDRFGTKVSKDIPVTQVSLNSIVVSQVTSERLSTEQVKQLVSDGTINISNPENYNVSKFDIVLTIANNPVPVSIPIATPKDDQVTGYEVYKLPDVGGGGGPSNPQPDEVIVFEHPIPTAPDQPQVSVPGVIIIEGKIKSLKEFYNVRLLLMNTSGIFTLKNVIANIEFPDGGLSGVLPADGIQSFGDILPGDGGQPGQLEKQFVIRGDAIGVRGVKVSFGGSVAGPGIPDDQLIPFNGSALTSVEVKGPPTFKVQVNHPDVVTAGVPYDLSVDITDTADIPALYASLALDVGADAQLVKCDSSSGTPQCSPIAGADTRALGDLLPRQTVREIFTINPLTSGPVVSCVAAADQNISLQVTVGTIGCLVGYLPPEKVSSNNAPSVSVVPTPNMLGVNPESAVTAFFSAAMNTGSITTGTSGSFNVYDKGGNLIPGRLRFVTVGGSTVAIWQENDGITDRLAANTEYSVVLSTGILSADGYALANSWSSRFTTTGTGSNDTTPPTLTLSVEAPVDPNYVLPGQIVKLDAYAADQGSGVARVELRMKDLSQAGSLYAMVDQKTAFAGDKPPFIFSIDSSKLTPGHAYQLMGTAYDGAGNTQDATVAIILALSSAPPSIAFPADLPASVLQGISLSMNPQVTGGVRTVQYFLDGAQAPFKTVNLAPYQATLVTLNLPIGNHTVIVNATDGLGQTGSASYAFAVLQNINVPVVSFTLPANGAKFVTGNSLSVSGGASDPVGISSVYYYLDSTAGAPVSSGTQPFVINTTGLATGAHTVYIVATNNLGTSNSTADLASFRSFQVVPLPSGPPPSSPAVSSVSYPVSGQVTISGQSVAGAQVDLTNTALGITVSLTADQNGVFSGKIPADAGQTVSLAAYDFSQSQSQSAPVTVTVPAAPVLSGIEVSPPAISFSAANAYQDITVTGHYSDGSTANLTSQSSFSSGDASVAAVSAAGRVVGLKTGTATITVTCNGQSATVNVTAAIVVLATISVDPAAVGLVSIGQPQQLAVTGHYSDGSTKNLTGSASYATGNPAVAAVNAAGTVTATGNGATQVTVAFAGAAPVTLPLTVDTSLDVPPALQVLSPTDGTKVERGQSVFVTTRATSAAGGVTGVSLNASGETSYTETKQLGASLDSTQSFSFVVSSAAAIGGNITMQLQATDTSGKSSPAVSITLKVADLTAPAVTITAPANQKPYNYGDTVNLAVSASDAVGVTQIRYETSGSLVLSGSAPISPVSRAAGASFSLKIPYGLQSPDVRLLAYASDAAGNEGQAIPVDIYVSSADITPPDTTVSAVDTPGNSVSTSVSYQVNSGMDDLDHVELYFRRNGIGTFNRYTNAGAGNPQGSFFPQTGNTGTVLFDSTQMGGDGSYEFYSVGVDKTGNREPAPVDASGKVVADKTALFNAGTLWTTISTATVIAAGDSSYDNKNIKVLNTTLTVNGTHSFHNVDLLQGAVLTHAATTTSAETRLDLSLWSLSVDSKSSINVDSLGYLGGDGGDNNSCPGRTAGNVAGSTLKSAGSYGGLGGAVSGTPNGVYGDMTAPAVLGSGGGCGDYSRAGGSGGGWVAIHAGGIALDGVVSANGGAGNGYQAGSGSGGTVSLVTSTLSGSGVIRANGGGNEVGGGGGRVAINYLDVSTMTTSNIQSLGGHGNAASGANGTVFLKSTATGNGTLVIDGQGVSTAYTTLPIPAGYVFDNIELRNSARVVADTPVVVSGTLSLTGGSILTHTLGSEAGLTIQANRVEVDATSSLDVSTRGYRGGLGDGNTGCNGITLGALVGAPLKSGGSYGGYGGAISGSNNAPYGQPSAAIYLGSGGGCGDYSRTGGHGGGLIKITAGEALVVDGSILANGGTGNGYQAGSGSGGSISITTSLLQGAGAIAANGGGNEVGGGGGRVAINYNYLGNPGQDLAGLRNISAFGGHGNASWGSAGTVLLNRGGQQYGDLYVDDNMTNKTTSSAWTPLTPLGFGKIVSLTANTITTSGAVPLALNGLVGMEVNPNLNQGQTYRVLSNTGTSITVDTTGKPDLTAPGVAQVGDSYAAIYRFDNVYFRRGGFLVLGDRLIVGSDMRIDEYGVLTHYATTMNFEPRLDLTAGTLEITGTGSIMVDAQGYLGGDRGANDCTGQTFGNADGSASKSGGSYGGLGGAVSGTPNGIYGSPPDPAALGSGGGCGDYSRMGGSGGGWVSIHAGGITLDGVISANGGNGTGYQSGGGSGGTINLVASTLSGGGLIRANGGGNEVGGGGGRIAVRYDSLSMGQSQFTLLGGTGNSIVGGNGTLFLKGNGQKSGDIIIDGANKTTPSNSTPLPPGYVFDNIDLRNGARVVADTPVAVSGTLSLTGGSVLTHTLGSEAGLNIQANRIEVDATSSLDVSARGYRGGLRDGNAVCNGVTLGALVGAPLKSGGSYGGYGGAVSGSNNAPYGQPSGAIYLGSGGGCGDYSRAGGHGGGLIKITAGEALVVDGSILANGGTGDGYQAGSGSGGSISITTSLLQGAGTIAANGGGNEVGGGGGRVAVGYNYLGNPGEDLAGLRNISAFGGHGNASWGSAGTVLLNRGGQQYGDLYVDDNMTNNTTSSAWTPLTPLGFGKIVNLTANTITTSGAVPLAVNGLVGMEVNPNLNQGQTYQVLSNTGTGITVDTTGKPDLTAPGMAQIGDSYAAIYRFDNVYFRRGGFLVLGDRLIVGNDMRIDEYGELTHYATTLNFEPRLDLTAGTLEITGTGSIKVDAQGYLGGDRGGNDCTGQTFGNVNGSAFKSGGSYGGLGGAWGGTPNGIYGGLTDPAALGSGGGCGDYSQMGGSGGGWVAIHAGSITLDGVISANGGNGTSYQSGGGSGGTINLVTSTLSGGGIIRANGGGNEVGGGGGRISLMYQGQLLLPKANISASGGHGNSVSGGAGTIYPP